MDGDAVSPRTAIATKLAGLSTTSNAEDQPCIFKVHKQLVNVNEKAYKPVLLAIGPYNDHLKVGQGIMEEHKLRYLKQMLERRKEQSLEDYMEALRKLEDRARKCYADAECISQKKDEFVGMMLLDGCFIIELFRKLEDKTLRDEHDPIFQMSWMLPEIARDLMLFENQLPYFVLTVLFNRSESNQTPLPNPGDSEQISCEITPCCESSASIDQSVPTRLGDLAISFFFGLLPFQDWEVNGSSVYPAEKSKDLKVGDKVKNVEFKRLLDLIYTIIKRSVVNDMEVVDRAIERQEVGVKFNIGEIFQPLFGKLEKRKGYKKINKDDGSIPFGTKPIRNATELKEAGIKFQKAKQAQDVWSCSSKRLQKCNLDEAPFKVILDHLLSSLPEEEHQTMAYTLRQIWFRRNKWVFEAQFSSPQQIINTVSSSISELQLQDGTPQQKRTKALPSSQWTKPPSGSYKVNWDAAIDKVQCRIGIGVIVRDSGGLVAATLRASRDSFPDPALGEAMAALRATQFCIELGFSSIILEGDSLVVVNLILGKEEKWNSTGLICKDIQLLLKQLKSWSVKHVSRQTNIVADCLAKSSLACSEESIHVEDYPHCIRNLLR